jgi:uncharacterized protein VirK/YbjX
MALGSPPCQESVLSTADSRLPLPQRQSRSLLALATALKQALRHYLMKSFPIGYEILFTPGNLDEPLSAVIAGHWRSMRLLAHPGLRALVAAHPQALYRPYRRYLATSFTKSARRAALQHHYAYLLPRISETFFPAVLNDRPQLWQKRIGLDVFDIRLSFTGELHHEGDLLLEFQHNGVPLYCLSFTIAPGYLADSNADPVILVARVQGAVGNFDAIRRATKMCMDIAPPYLLTAAVQGIAAALNIGVIAGIRNNEQLTANIDADRNVYFDYDAFWRTYLGSEAKNFYLISVPIREKPLAQISTVHRRRTRLKRQFKTEVTETSKAIFRGLLIGFEECADREPIAEDEAMETTT